jgi:hypothetical protein
MPHIGQMMMMITKHGILQQTTTDRKVEHPGG